MFEYFDKAWWSYQSIFGQKCLKKAPEEISKCSRDALEETGASKSDILGI